MPGTESGTQGHPRTSPQLGQLARDPRSWNPRLWVRTPMVLFTPASEAPVVWIPNHGTEMKLEFLRLGSQAVDGLWPRTFLCPRSQGLAVEVPDGRGRGSGDGSQNLEAPSSSHTMETRARTVLTRRSRVTLFFAAETVGRRRRGRRKKSTWKLQKMVS